MLTDINQLIACHDCDLLHKKQSLNNGETALCSRCGAKLYRQKAHPIDNALALSLASVVFFIIALWLPFLEIQANGVYSQINLFSSISTLYENDMKLVSIIVCMVLIIIPAIRILGLLYLTIPIKLFNKPIKSRWTYRLVEYVIPWNMIEVFLIAILVTFVKLGAMATIIFGVSFWAFIALVICMVALNASIDSHSLWERSLY